MAEELGHYYTTVGNILDQSDTRNRKQELLARLWAYDKMIGLEGIIKSYQHGCHNLYETAEYLEVTKEFLLEALQCYAGKYGTEITFGKYKISFIPTLEVEKNRELFVVLYQNKNRPCANRNGFLTHPKMRLISQNYYIIFGNSLQVELTFRLAVIFILIFKEDDIMTRRKRRMKLPNGFGSIKYLGSGRRNPYAAYPPATEWSENGTYQITPKALAYTETWEDAYELLTAYNMEKQGKVKLNRNVLIDRTPTFSEVYTNYYKEKFFNSPKKLSESSMYSTQAAFKNCTLLHSKQMGQIRYDDLQNIINNCTLKHSSIELMVSLLHQIYKYAMKYEIIDKDYSAFLYIPKEDDDESGVPFSEEEIKIFWKNKEDPIIQMILIMCYSGFRIAAYQNIEINLKERYFKGGVKTKASKDRIVPIHSSIYDLVKHRYSIHGSNLLGMANDTFRNKMYPALKELGIEKHTPHDCRHTFSMLCEKYGVNENDRKRLMGHSFGSDITNQKYGHRSLDDLKTEIEKIKTCY